MFSVPSIILYVHPFSLREKGPSKWQENSSHKGFLAFKLGGEPLPPAHSIKLRETLLAVTIVASFLFLALSGIGIMGSTFFYFFVEAKVMKDFLYATTLGASVGVTCFSIALHSLLEFKRMGKASDILF